MAHDIKKQVGFGEPERDWFPMAFAGGGGGGGGGGGSQTPISHTAPKPSAAMESHSTAGTEPRSTGFPDFWLSSVSHTHVLISNSVG